MINLFALELMFGTLIAIGVSTLGGHAIADTFAKTSESWGGVWGKGLLVSLCFAGFGAITHSMPSCLEYDDPGPYGRCVQYDTAEPTQTAEEKAQNIFFNTAVGGTLGMFWLQRKLKKDGKTIETYNG